MTPITIENFVVFLLTEFLFRGLPAAVGIGATIYCIYSLTADLVVYPRWKRKEEALVRLLPREVILERAGMMLRRNVGGEYWWSEPSDPSRLMEWRRQVAHDELLTRAISDMSARTPLAVVNIP